jgi:hypothetical protein
VVDPFKFLSLSEIAFRKDISPAERTEWETWLAGEKLKHEELSTKFERNEDQINQIFYKLFDLTADEVKILEQSIT